MRYCLCCAEALFGGVVGMSNAPTTREMIRGCRIGEDGETAGFNVGLVTWRFDSAELLETFRWVLVWLGRNARKSFGSVPEIYALSSAMNSASVLAFAFAACCPSLRPRDAYI
ncbi:hypothetical protein H310_00624 [Aphanomyces invadans]|uniref:Uncharacterized protein n=1 Tax=Aphanomyces invadans TaxID=157072 RepID=A0A024UUT3_9STRA|nr:hypothetical protein H310_00624 [Aphanomyces invadans]ETW10281.1 hypothetical protein H310_00624 [Aphanomyces invadans]|eukprot:XP_008861692.1 hypothetical protein H310_00624 [Aphanomyces invadans]